MRVFLDACCLINLLATGRAEEILDRLPYHFAISRYVAEREILRLEPVVRAEDEPARVTVDELAHAGCLTIHDLAGEEELAELVRFATVLDDGEASICALAVAQRAAAHQAAVATDDRKAIAVLGRHEPPVPVLQTPELLFEWSRQDRILPEELRSVLRAIRRRARFVPRRGSPRYDWWRKLMR